MKSHTDDGQTAWDGTHKQLLEMRGIAGEPGCQAPL